MPSSLLSSRLRRLLWILWCGALALFLGVARYPISSLTTRGASLALIAFAWGLPLLLLWRIWIVRYAWLGLTALVAGFLAWPGGSLPSTGDLRTDYATALRRYEGVTYVWGGENSRGIDCSGLIRRGLIESLAARGLRTLSPSLVRRALILWWNDTTAAALGEGQDGLTVPVLEVPSINAMDHAQILPGDLAVTRNGLHIMAYLGDRRWIEADPLEAKVIAPAIPATQSWFQMPMKIVRWKLLAP